MPVENLDQLDERTIRTSFQKTPKMSTYVVAFTVSDFLNIESADKSLQVFARPNVIEDARFVLEEGELLLKEIINYFGIQLPIPKMKIIAIPKLKHAGMENWGLISMR